MVAIATTAEDCGCSTCTLIDKAGPRPFGGLPCGVGGDNAGARRARSRACRLSTWRGLVARCCTAPPATRSAARATAAMASWCPVDTFKPTTAPPPGERRVELLATGHMRSCKKLAVAALIHGTADVTSL